MKTIINFLHSIFIYCLYTVFYLDERDQSNDEDEGDYGYYVKKRVWVFTLLTPLILPVFIFKAIIDYADWVTNWYLHRIAIEKQKLSFKQKVAITKRLLK